MIRKRKVKLLLILCMYVCVCVCVCVCVYVCMYVCMRVSKKKGYNVRGNQEEIKDTCQILTISQHIHCVSLTQNTSYYIFANK